MIGGKVTPPEDLVPAIDALNDDGRRYLSELVDKNGGKIEPWMIAKSADYERGDCHR